MNNSIKNVTIFLVILVLFLTVGLVILFIYLSHLRRRRKKNAGSLPMSTAISAERGAPPSTRLTNLSGTKACLRADEDAAATVNRAVLQPTINVTPFSQARGTVASSHQSSFVVSTIPRFPSEKLDVGADSGISTSDAADNGRPPLQRTQSLVSEVPDEVETFELMEEDKIILLDEVPAVQHDSDNADRPGSTVRRHLDRSTPSHERRTSKPGSTCGYEGPLSTKDGHNHKEEGDGIYAKAKRKKRGKLSSSRKSEIYKRKTSDDRKSQLSTSATAATTATTEAAKEPAKYASPEAASTNAVHEINAEIYEEIDDNSVYTTYKASFSKKDMKSRIAAIQAKLS